MASADIRYRLYGSPDSANLVVRFVLEELGASYDYCAIDRGRRDHRSATYLNLNPQGLIPVLVDPTQDEPMFETAAIILHLADSHGSLSPATESRQRGRFLKWLFFLSNTLHADLRIAFNPGRYLQAGTDTTPLANRLAERIVSGFALIEQELVRGGGPYLLGDALSVLDFYLAACARWAQLYQKRAQFVPAGGGRLMVLLKALEQRPSVLRSAELESMDGDVFSAPQHLQLPGVTA